MRAPSARPVARSPRRSDRVARARRRVSRRTTRRTTRVARASDRVSRAVRALRLRRAFGLYAETACEEITTKFREHQEGVRASGQRERATYVAFFGQTPFINSVAYAIATAAGLEAAALDELLEMKLGEAEGVLVPLFGKGKSGIHLKRPL